MLTEEDKEKYQFILKSNMTNLQLDIEFPYKQMYEEVEPFFDNFISHNEHKTTKLSTIMLYGTDVYHTTPSKARESGKIANWTTMAEMCPITKEFFNEVWPQKKHRKIKWLLFYPGGTIESHNDSNECMLGDGVFFSLNHPQGCEIYYDNELVPWKPGQCRMFDFSKYHHGKNNSNEKRLHILTSYHSEDHLSKSASDDFINLVIRSYEKQGYDYKVKKM